MGTQGKAHPFLRGWSLMLLLLALVIPPASTQALSYEEAALSAVDAFNQQSSDPNLYRILELDQEPEGDYDPQTPRPISFLVKETVCPKDVQLPLEQCDFKEKGLVKQCLGTVTLDRIRGSFDINCDRLKRVHLLGRLGGFLKRGGRKIGEKLERIGQTIKDFFRNLKPREEGDIEG